MAKKSSAAGKSPASAESMQPSLMSEASVSFAISRKVLEQAIERARQVVKGNKTIPMLTHILVQAGAGRIRFAATDLEFGVDAAYPAEVSRQGMFLLPPKVMEVVKLLPGDTVYVQYIDRDAKRRVVIDSGKHHSEYETLETDGFPASFDFSSARSFRMLQALLIGMLDQVAFTAARDTSRVGLNTIYFEPIPAGTDEVKEQRLRFVSTDGHRLGLVECRPDIDVEDLGGKEPGVLVSIGCCQLWRKIWQAPPADGQRLELLMSENVIAIRDGDLVVWGRLMEGEFVDYQQVIPKAFLRDFEVDRKALLDACERAALVNQDTIRLKVGDALEVSSHHPDKGEHREEMPLVSGVDGEPLSIGFNPKYIEQVLDNLGCDAVQLRIAGTVNPCLIWDKTDPSLLYIVMPVRLQ